MSEASGRFAQAIVDTNLDAELPPEPEPRPVGEMIEQAQAVLPVLEQEIRAGRDAQAQLAQQSEELAGYRGAEAIDRATELLYDGEVEPGEILGALVQDAPDRVPEFIQEWQDYDPDAVGEFYDGLGQVDRALQQQQIEAARTDATVRHLESLDAIQHVMRKHGKEAATVAPLIGEILRQHPEAMPTDKREAEGLYRAAREGARAEAVSRLKQGILDAWGPGGVANPDGFVSVEPIRPERIVPKPTAVELKRNIKAAFETKSPVDEMMAGLQNDAALKAHRAQQRKNYERRVYGSEL